MRRADRLFEIVLLLRGRRLLRARDLAARLEVSERTVYRDIRDLMASGVPIEGEAGVGYTLRREFDLPPLLFDETELEALALGARIVETWADPRLARAARSALDKVAAAVPAELRGHLDRVALLAPSAHAAKPVTVDAAALRRALRDRITIRFYYEDAAGRQTFRCVRPLALCFYGPVWLLIAWCELRCDFRCFRLDRMCCLDLLPDYPFRTEAGKSLEDYMRREQERGTWRPGIC